MYKNYLLPYRFKRIGFWMSIPSCAACLYLLLSGVLDCDMFRLPALAIFPDSTVTDPEGIFAVT